MNTQEMIPAMDFCFHHNITISFIESLNRSGLIQITHLEERIFVPTSELKKLETYVTLHNDLDINIEGIETVSHLLHRIEYLQEHVQALNNRLRIYEIVDS